MYIREYCGVATKARSGASIADQRLRFIWTALPTIITLITIIPLRITCKHRTPVSKHVTILYSKYMYIYISAVRIYIYIYIYIYTYISSCLIFIYAYFMVNN
jgi:hypothetical protein